MPVAAVFGSRSRGAEFRGRAGQSSLLIVGYFTYSFLAFMCLRIPSKIVRIPAFLVATVPMVIGYASSTIGLLGLMFIVADYTRPPESVKHMAAGLTCRITGWGSAASSSGYDVGLFRSWSGISFLERRIVSASVVQAGYSGTAPPDVSCDDLLAKYESR
jgi:hypothetical protein